MRDRTSLLEAENEVLRSEVERLRKAQDVRHLFNENHLLRLALVSAKLEYENQLQRLEARYDRRALRSMNARSFIRRWFPLWFPVAVSLAFGFAYSHFLLSPH